MYDELETTGGLGRGGGTGKEEFVPAFKLHMEAGQEGEARHGGGSRGGDWMEL